MQGKLRIEQWPFIVFVAALPFATVFRFTFFGNLFQIADLLFVIAAIAWLISLAVRRRPPVWDRIYLFLGAYGVVLVLSAVFSENTSLSFVKLVGKFYLLAIPVLAINVIDSEIAFKRVVQAWVAAAAVVLVASLAGVVAFYAGVRDPEANLVLHRTYGSLPPGEYPRLEGLFAYPAMLCNYLGITWIFAVLMWWSGWLRPAIFWVLAGGLFIVEILTLTPGLGGIFLSTSILAWLKLRESGRITAGRLCLAAGMIVALAFLAAASVNLFNIESAFSDLQPSHRAVAWKTAFETFLDDSILGRGVGVPVARSEFIDPSGNYQYLTDAHNTYLSVLGETGMAGFFAWLLIVAALMRRCCTVIGEGSLIPMAVTLIFLDAVLYQGLTGSFEDTRHLWVFLGLAATAWARSTLKP